MVSRCVVVACNAALRCSVGKENAGLVHRRIAPARTGLLHAERGAGCPVALACIGRTLSMRHEKHGPRRKCTDALLEDGERDVVGEDIGGEPPARVTDRRVAFWAQAFEAARIDASVDDFHERREGTGVSGNIGRHAMADAHRRSAPPGRTGEEPSKDAPPERQVNVFCIQQGERPQGAQVSPL